MVANISDRNITIGANYSGDTKFDGMIDEVKIYNKTLTENEIVGLYMSGLPRHSVYESDTIDDDTNEDYNPLGGAVDDFNTDSSANWNISGSGAANWTWPGAVLKATVDEDQPHKYINITYNPLNVSG